MYALLRGILMLQKKLHTELFFITKAKGDVNKNFFIIKLIR